jgi:hypothetical protein
MHLKISTSASSIMAKYMCYVAVSKSEELILNADSEEQCVSDDSDTEAPDDL